MLFQLCDPQKKQEDGHSDLSGDTGTFDSGIGGSVSDTGKKLGLMGVCKKYLQNSYSKTYVKWPLKNRQKRKIIITICSLMKVESIAECFP